MAINATATQQDREIAKLLGIPEDDVDKLATWGQRNPAFFVPKDGSKVKGKFLSDKLEKIETQDNKGKMQIAFITPMEDEVGVHYTFWINQGSSTAREYFRVRTAEKHQLAGKWAFMWKESYEHQKYGTQFALRMQIIENPYTATLPAQASPVAKNSPDINSFL